MSKSVKRSLAVTVLSAVLLAANTHTAMASTSPLTTAPIVPTVEGLEGVSAKEASTIKVTVASGDTLSEIRYRICGDGDWNATWQENASAISDPNLIFPGQVFTVSCTTVAAPPAATPQTPPPAPTAEWFNPLPGHVSFCNYWEWRGTYNHRGEDIPADWGTPIHAVHAGQVHHQWDNGGGNMTIITHDGMAEVYMHQSSYNTPEGGWVNGNDIIGYVGATGNVTGPHLHLEIQPWGPWNGVTSPDKWLNDRGVYIGC